MRHELKILPQYLYRLQDGTKTSEVRFNDRDYQAGDVCALYEFKNGQTTIVADFIYQITHVHTGLGLASGYALLSFKGAKK